MSKPAPRRGPWTHRLLIRFFTVVLTLLLYWLQGFLLDDIGNWPGPSAANIDAQVDPQLSAEHDRIDLAIRAAETDIADNRSRQQILQEGTRSSQETMNQMLQLQRLSLEKDVKPSAEQQAAIADAEKLFLSNQKTYLEINAAIAGLEARLQGLRKEQAAVDSRLAEVRLPLELAFEREWQQHLLKLAMVKLGVMLPLIALAGGLFWKFRTSLYSPLVTALGIAVLAKTTVVMHEYVPYEVVKYVLILGLLAFTVWLLIRLLRTLAKPQVDWLLKQYRQAYEAFLCPICDYPIRRGPLKFLHWTRRSLKRLQFPVGATAEMDEPYTCPMCATRLFEECAHCHGTRHSLLPACAKCGEVKAIENPQTTETAAAVKA